VKILFLQDHLQTGGAAKAAQRYRRLLSLAGHDTAVACGDGESSAEVFRLQGKLPRGPARVVQTCLPSRIQNRWMRHRVLQAWAHALERFQPDVVWSHNLHGARKWGWSLAMIEAAWPRAPLIWTLHDMTLLGDGDPYWPDAELEERAASSPLRNAFTHLPPGRLAWTAPSDWLASLARKGSGRPCALLPYPIDLDVFSPGEQRSARRRLGLPEKGRLFLAGAERVDDPRKGLGLLSRLEGFFQEQGIHLVLFGRNGESGPGRTHLGVLADEVSLREAYRAADLYLHLGGQDNAPCQIQESLACGTPVMAFGVGGVPEMIRDGETGFLLPLGVETEFQKKFIGKLAPRLGRLAGMRPFCRGDAEIRYGEKALLSAIGEIFRTVSASVARS